MASRKVEDLTPEMQFKYALFHDEMDKAGLNYILTCTYRSQAEQDALYAQGRTKTGKKVTWTRHSKHNDRKAFDIAMLINGKISWNTADYLKAGEIGQKVGLEWGGSWIKTKDFPHFELKES
jgi:peptidoglycan LD-endopeptidase CwlK